MVRKRKSLDIHKYGNIYLVGRYNPVLKLPKISTFACGQSLRITVRTLPTTSILASCSNGVGTIHWKKSSISSCNL